MKAFTDVARKTLDAVGSMNRLAYLYERRFRNMEMLGSQDLRGELSAEKKKNDELLKKLESASKEAAHLKRIVAPWIWRRRGRKTVELEDRLKSEKKRLRSRREKYAENQTSKALIHVADLFQARMNRVKAHLDDKLKINPKFLDYNQVCGNVALLDELIEAGEIEIKSTELMPRLIADRDALKAEVEGFEITEIEKDDFDVWTLFEKVPEEEYFEPSASGGHSETEAEKDEETSVEDASQRKPETPGPLPDDPAAPRCRSEVFILF
ncbi:hypothetical protein AtEden1_Chr1g0035261 [Arabidopsis thaliana]